MSDENANPNPIRQDLEHAIDYIRMGRLYTAKLILLQTKTGLAGLYHDTQHDTYKDDAEVVDDLLDLVTNWMSDDPKERREYVEDADVHGLFTDKIESIESNPSPTAFEQAASTVLQDQIAFLEDEIHRNDFSTDVDDRSIDLPTDPDLDLDTVDAPDIDLSHLGPEPSSDQPDTDDPEPADAEPGDTVSQGDSTQTQARQGTSWLPVVTLPSVADFPLLKEGDLKHFVRGMKMSFYLFGLPFVMAGFTTMLLSPRSEPGESAATVAILVFIAGVIRQLYQVCKGNLGTGFPRHDGAVD